MDRNTLILSILKRMLREATNKVKLNWDDLLIKLSGKKVAVIGQRAVGKTHLITFLSTGSIPTEYEQTLEATKSKQRRFQLQGLDLKLKPMIDVSGAKDAYKVWKKCVEESDIVLYLFRADLLYKDDEATQTRVIDDIHQIKQWIKNKKHSRRFFIIGTHCDLIPEYAALNKNTKGDFKDSIAKLDVVKEINQLVPSEEMFLAAMNDQKGTEELIYKVFYQIQSSSF